MRPLRHRNHASLFEDAWLNLGDISGLQIDSPFDNRTEYEIENPHVHVLNLMRKPEYFPWTCKHVFNIDILPFQNVILQELWRRPFPMLIGARGMSKSFLQALYAMLRALLCQGSKIVIVGAAFRQAKVEFEYCEAIWNNAPVLRDIVASAGKDRSGPRRDVDRCSLIIGDSVITALPLGNGEKIRGQRATHLLGVEFASIPRDIYENVVAGFAAVTANPVQNVKRMARIKALKEAGRWSEELEKKEASVFRGNQTVLSGTANYSFNHFYSYWQMYKAIIESRGDPRKIGEIFNGQVPENFNWRDYSIIRIPYNLLPPGFMDEKQVTRSRAMVHSGIFSMEFCSVFCSDSEGFFRRSLIEKCVVGEKNPVELPSCGTVSFRALLRGDPKCRFVIAVDPAADQDNFSIVVLECWPDHRRVVYCWTTNRQSHRDRMKAGLVKEQDFYGYCARKIRDLMKLFPCDRVLMDSQGGGVAVEEALHDSAKLEEGEVPIWQVVDPDFKKRKDSDDKAGQHILELVNFADNKWVVEANHGLRKDLEDRQLLFPEFDAALISLAIEDDKLSGRSKVNEDGQVVSLYDTLEDVYMEIEDLKKEMTLIVHTQSPSGRDRWDTPEVKLAGSKKGRLRKDRYSALLMANMGARILQHAEPPPEYRPLGGFARDLVTASKEKRKGQMYVAPDWFNQAVAACPSYGSAVRRG